MFAPARSTSTPSTTAESPNADTRTNHDATGLMMRMGVVRTDTYTSPQEGRRRSGENRSRTQG
eukprot:7279266-Prymnesium_polylepis.1